MLLVIADCSVVVEGTIDEVESVTDCVLAIEVVEDVVEDEDRVLEENVVGGID